MQHFWSTIIEPILETINAKNIVEIGFGKGGNTINLLEFCVRTDATLHAVDPSPKFDVAPWQRRYGKHFVFHQSLSLNAIPLIDRFDVVLIDGDHNWYTVFNELKLIEKCCLNVVQCFPVIMLHDIGWPYGRRDLYYNPENIPKIYRKPYSLKGLIPGSLELQEKGGLNRHLYNAIYENVSQNGVLTAVEDFLKETKQELELLKIPGLCGLGILVSRELIEENKELMELLRSFELTPVVRRYIEKMEEMRIELEIKLQEKALKEVIE